MKNLKKLLSVFAVFMLFVSVFALNPKAAAKMDEKYDEKNDTITINMTQIAPNSLNNEDDIAYTASISSASKDNYVLYLQKGRFLCPSSVHSLKKDGSGISHLFFREFEEGDYAINDKGEKFTFHLTYSASPGLIDYSAMGLDPLDYDNKFMVEYEMVPVKVPVSSEETTEKPTSSTETKPTETPTTPAVKPTTPSDEGTTQPQKPEDAISERASLIFKDSSYKLMVGKQRSLSAVFKVESMVNGKVVKETNKKVTPKWSVSNKKIATITSNGKLKGVKPGKVIVTASYNNLKVRRTFTIWKVKKVKITGKKTVKKNKSITLKAKVLCTEGGKASGVKWKSSNSKIARVNAKGKVTGLKKGKVTIKAISKDNKKIVDKKIITVK